MYTLLGRASNVVSPKAMGRLSFKLNIYLMILNFWIHFENLPVNSVLFIAKQFLNSISREWNTVLHESANKVTQFSVNCQFFGQKSVNFYYYFLGQFLKTKLELKQQKLTELLKGHNNYMKTADQRRTLPRSQMQPLVPNATRALSATRNWCQIQVFVQAQLC